MFGARGRYGAGLSRINDGSFLVPPAHDVEDALVRAGRGRLAIVFNGSPLFTGAAGSGESEIRRWIIENDWLEAVVALPDQLFYNTGISTYFWIVSNRKSSNRKGKVQLIDARGSFTKMRKSLGEKRKEISEQQIADIVRFYGSFDQQHSDEDEARVKIFPNESFDFLRIRPGAAHLMPDRELPTAPLSMRRQGRRKTSRCRFLSASRRVRRRQRTMGRTPRMDRSRRRNEGGDSPQDRRSHRSRPRSHRAQRFR